MSDEPIDREYLAHLMNDPDWDCSQRGDVFEMLPKLVRVWDAMPTTADGVKIMPGMSIWREYGMSETVIELMVRQIDCGGCVHDGIGWFKGERFWSTREAAVAAIGAAK